MIHISRNPDAPFMDHPRGPHFVFTDQKHLREGDDGEDATKLPLQEMINYIGEHPGEPDVIEAMALISNNNGMALQHWKLPTSVSEAFLANGPRVHKTPLEEFISMDLERLARVLAQNPHPKIRAHIIDFIMQEGIKPNMDRISIEFCKECKHHE